MNILLPLMISSVGHNHYQLTKKLDGKSLGKNYQIDLHLNWSPLLLLY